MSTGTLRARLRAFLPNDELRRDLEAAEAHLESHVSDEKRSEIVELVRGGRAALGGELVGLGMDLVVLVVDGEAEDFLYFASEGPWYTLLATVVDVPLAPWIATFAATRVWRDPSPSKVIGTFGDRALPSLLALLVSDLMPPRSPASFWGHICTHQWTSLTQPTLAKQATELAVAGLVDASSAVRTAALALARQVREPATLAIDARLAASPGKRQQRLLLEARAALEPAAVQEPAPATTAARPAARHELPARLAGRPLGQALLALTDGDDRAALTHLVTAWGEVRAPAVAELIDLVGARVTAPALAGESVSEKERQWHARAAGCDPSELGRLVAAPWPSQWKGGLARVEALRKFPPDPRFGQLLLRALTDRPYTSSNSAWFFYRLIIKDLTKVADHRTLAPLLASAPALTSLMGGWIGNSEIRSDFTGQSLAQRFAGGTAPALGDDDLELVQRIGQVLDGRTAGRPDVGPMFDEVFAHPDDDNLRRVLADALGEVGDPRGELIVLQCERAAGRGTTRAVRRERELLKAHEEQWLHDLPLTSPRRFERGFLVAGELSVQSGAWPTSKPAWRLIEELTIAQWSQPADLVRFLDEIVPDLRILRGVRSEVVSLLGARDKSCRLERISWTDDGRYPGWPSLRGLSSLRHVELRYNFGTLEIDRFATINAEKWLQLETASLSTGIETLPRWLAVLPRLPPSMQSLHVAALPIRRRPGLPGWHATVSRDGEGRWSVLHARWEAGRHRGYASDLAVVLEGLPADTFSSVTVERSRVIAADPAVQKRLDEAVARFATIPASVDTGSSRSR